MSFDRLAPHYGWMERLLAGQQLQRCRTALLHHALAARSILLIGEGHGRFLVELCRANPGASVVCADASPEMLRAARRRLERARINSKKVSFHPVPILDFEPRGNFDLVVTQFFLDCFPAQELEQVIIRISAMLRPGARWMLADFQVPEAGWRKCRARVVLGLAYRFFRLAAHLPASELIAPGPYLIANRFVRKEKITFNFGLLYAELWEKGD